MRRLDEKLSNLIHESTWTGGPLEYIIAAYAAMYNNHIAALLWFFVVTSSPDLLNQSGILLFFPAILALSSKFSKELLKRLRPAIN